MFVERLFRGMWIIGKAFYGVKNWMNVEEDVMGSHLWLIGSAQRKDVNDVISSNHHNIGFSVML